MRLFRRDQNWSIISCGSLVKSGFACNVNFGRGAGGCDEHVIIYIVGDTLGTVS